MELAVGFSADVRDGVRPWKQILQEGGIGVFHVFGDLSEQVLQVFIWLQTICFCCLDEAVDRGAGPRAVYGVKDMPIVAAHAERTDRREEGSPRSENGRQRANLSGLRSRTVILTLRLQKRSLLCKSCPKWNRSMQSLALPQKSEAVPLVPPKNSIPLHLHAPAPRVVLPEEKITFCV